MLDFATPKNHLKFQSGQSLQTSSHGWVHHQHCQEGDPSHLIPIHLYLNISQNYVKKTNRYSKKPMIKQLNESKRIHQFKRTCKKEKTMKSNGMTTTVLRKLTKEQSCILTHKSRGNEPSSPHRLHQLGSLFEFCSIMIRC